MRIKDCPFFFFFFYNLAAANVFKLTMLVDGVYITKCVVQQQIPASMELMVILRFGFNKIMKIVN